MEQESEKKFENKLQNQIQNLQQLNIDSQDNQFQMKNEDTNTDESNFDIPSNQNSIQNNINYNTPQKIQNQPNERKMLSGKSQIKEQVLSDIMYSLNNEIKMSEANEFIKFFMSCSIYVDKTNLIRDTHYENSLFITAPERWGKTLNLSMMKAFYEPDIKNLKNYENGKFNITQENDNLKIFQQLKIGKWEEINQFQGKIPVLYFNFTSIDNFNNIEELKIQLLTIIKNECFRHAYICKLKLINFIKLLDQSLNVDFQDSIDSLLFKYNLLLKQQGIKDDVDMNSLHKFFSGKDDTQEINQSIMTLLRQIGEFYQVNMIKVLIDEFDKPIHRLIQNVLENISIQDQRIQQLQLIKDTIQKLSSFINTLINEKYVYFEVKVILTGVYNILDYANYSSMNEITHVSINTFNSNKILNNFGFNNDDIDYLLDKLINQKNQHAEKSKKRLKKYIKYWYNGQNIGNQDLYTPSSVIMYIQNLVAKKNFMILPQFESYWRGSISGDLIDKILKCIQQQNQQKNINLNKFLEKLQDIVQKKDIQFKYDDKKQYFIILVQNLKLESKSLEELFSYILINSGYLTVQNAAQSRYRYPSNEVKKLIQQKVYDAYIQNFVKEGTWQKFQDQNNIDFCKDTPENIGDKFAMLLNIAKEGVEEMNEKQVESILFKAYTSSIDSNYKINSQEYSGNGITDFIIYFLHRIDIYEIKYKKKIINPQNVDHELVKAFKQILEKKYMYTVYTKMNTQESKKDVKSIRIIALLIYRYDENEYLCKVKYQEYNKQNLEKMFMNNQKKESEEKFTKKLISDQALKEILIQQANKTENIKQIQNLIKEKGIDTTLSDLQSLQLYRVGQITCGRILNLIKESSNQSNQTSKGGKGQQMREESGEEDSPSKVSEQDDQEDLNEESKKSQSDLSEYQNQTSNKRVTRSRKRLEEDINFINEQSPPGKKLLNKKLPQTKY